MWILSCLRKGCFEKGIQLHRSSAYHPTLPHPNLTIPIPRIYPFATSATDVKMLIPVFVQSLKSSILTSTTFQMGKSFLGVVSAAVKQSRRKANMVAQGVRKMPLRLTSGSLQTKNYFATKSKLFLMLWNSDLLGQGSLVLSCRAAVQGNVPVMCYPIVPTAWPVMGLDSLLAFIHPTP